ncbi:hypothetical protein M409DRAFT_20519 [Zasmidium cellare ATCC 36951]|uniref:Aminoglycoside phosphotransferase domain-containing protein n=1 Tax=Zasmidium cellare ATCC 36951 TaxID=1080233 RepID=A0A6A6CRH2_ZASCE|nr:uncharacterized protein M409DRAFT_20519 [Zasmidium cellare ATCC 36951]KAF2169293.1 hypothetical protein M409DRAFT_20519 [Zasmidium cellare ATCC 36951]
MGTPLEALPTVSVPAIEQLLPTINLPPAKTITILNTKAEYHVIALLTWNDQEDLILRIAGPHVPRTKTENEVAVITWLQRNTKIPVPAVVHHDSSTDNPLGCEYVLQKRLKGQSLDLVWPSLTEDEKLKIYDFMVEVLRELTSHEWKHIASLRLTAEGEIVPGPVLDERFWEARDIEKYFPPGETVESLNPLGPYSSYVEFSIARLEKSMHAIRKHESLAFMRPHLPLLEDFIEALREDSKKLNRTNLCLAHRDLHMGNIMYDVEGHTVTGILDWEFSVVMPVQQGELSRAFMHDLVDDGGWGERKGKMLEVLRERSQEEGGGDVVERFGYVSEDQEEMQEVVDLVRAIVEVSPRGQREGERMGWRDEVLEILEGWMD